MTSEKRSSSSVSKKHKKARYCKDKQYVGSHGVSMQHPSMGFIIMTDMNKEKRAVNEFLQLIRHILSMQEENIANSADTNTNNDDEANDEDDIEKQMAKELSTLKTDHSLFTPLDFKLQCVRLITTTHPQIQNPVSTLSHLFDYLKSDVENKKTTALLKILPFQVTCRANMEDLTSGIKLICSTVLVDLVNKYQKETNGSQEKRVVTISGMFRRRFHQTIVREEALPLMIREACAAVPNNSIKVDLKTPDLVFFVEIVKGVCCLCITPDFSKYHKYNVEKIYNPTQSPPDTSSACAVPSATTTADNSTDNKEEEEK